MDVGRFVSFVREEIEALGADSQICGITVCLDLVEWLAIQLNDGAPWEKGECEVGDFWS